MSDRSIPADVDERTRRRIRNAIVLTLGFGSGAMDTWSFYAFGKVFVGIMTGNMILAGGSIVHGDLAYVARAVTAFVAYLGGCAFATKVCGERLERAVWSPRITRCLAIELVTLVALGVVWIANAGRESPALFALLAIGGFALGLQGVATATIGIPDVSTTYATGMMTSFVRKLASATSLAEVWMSPAVVASIVCGAALAALILDRASTFVPLAPIAPLVMGLALAAIFLRPITTE